MRDRKSTYDRDGDPVASARRRPIMTFVLLFFALALVLDGIAGERGWIANRRDRQALEQAELSLKAKRRENAELRDVRDRLQRKDPATIEDVARRDLRFIRPGEKVFVIKDVPKATK
jgi:cell division protein FtsB